MTNLRSIKDQYMLFPPHNSDPRRSLKVFYLSGHMTSGGCTCGWQVPWVLWVTRWGLCRSEFFSGTFHGYSIIFGCGGFWHLKLFVTFSLLRSWAVFAVSQHALSCWGACCHQGVQVPRGLPSRVFGADGLSQRRPHEGQDVSRVLLQNFAL